MWIRFLSRNIPWSREWQPAPVFLPGKFLGQRPPVGYRQWGCKESDMTEHTCQELCLDIRRGCYQVFTTLKCPLLAFPLLSSSTHFVCLSSLQSRSSFLRENFKLLFLNTAIADGYKPQVRKILLVHHCISTA